MKLTEFVNDRRVLDCTMAPLQVNQVLLLPSGAGRNLLAETIEQGVCGTVGREPALLGGLDQIGFVHSVPFRGQELRQSLPVVLFGKREEVSHLETIVRRPRERVKIRCYLGETVKRSAPRLPRCTGFDTLL